MDRPHWLTPSAWVLIAANLIPVGGVFFLGWGVFDVLLLYWTENVVIGVFNVLRMLMAQPANPASWLAKFVLVPFFIVHYGMFTAVHGFFLVAFFQDEATGWNLPGPSASLSQTMFEIINSVVGRPGALLVVGSLVLSHGYSFVVNYLGNGENTRASLQRLMSQPYSRVVVMHLTIIGMGFLVILTGTRAVGVVLLVVLKIAVDLHAHRAEHRRLSPPPDPA
jgi:hypothetical protein